MNMLVIAPQPFFSPRGTPFSVYYRTKVASQLGAKIDMLTYGEGVDVDIPNVRIVRIPRVPLIGPVGIGPSWRKALLDVFMVLWTVAMLLRRRYDVVHAHEEAVFWCRFLKPVFRFKLVYDMHSSLPQQLTNFQFTSWRWVIACFERLERTCLRHADAVITICPDLREYALAQGVPHARHVMIENSLFDPVQLRNGTDGQIIEPMPPFGGDSAGATVVYAGTFEPYQGIDMLVRAFARVAEVKPDARLLLAGGSPKQVQRVRQLADSVGLNGRCVLTGQVPKDRARQLTAGADVLVSPRIQGTNTPLKLYEQLASGKPIVATRIWSHTQVLDDESCFMVEPDQESLASGILAAISDDDRRRRVVARAHDLYESRYSRSAYEQKMQQLMEMLA